MSTTRHRWVKLRVHVYICRVCGTGRVNSCDETGWSATWHRPDGTAVVAPPTTPPCVKGPRTEAALAKYAQQIRDTPPRKATRTSRQ